MFTTLPQSADKFMHWTWAQFQPYADDLLKRTLTSTNVEQWLENWSQLSRMVSEIYQRLYVAITVDTTDAESKQRYNAFLDDVYPKSQAVNQECKQKLLSSGLQPADFEIPLRNMRTEAEIFRQENLPLLAKELKLSSEYDEIIGAQTIMWEGREVTLAQLQPVYMNPDRQVRQRAWQSAMQRRLADRQKLNDLWGRLMAIRGQVGANANLPDYRAYMWKEKLRFDYTPQDSYSFHAAIEQVVVPAVQRIYEKHRQRLGLDTLRPWDLDVDTFSRPPLKPYHHASELEEKVAAIFHRVDPQLGRYFELMRRQGLLDVENRKGKAPGAYCTSFDVVNLPFIFENAVGLHDDVQTLIHEGGHAFHVFETAHLPYHQQQVIPMEFIEVASMAMELLTAPYLPASQGGFYSEKDTARARIEHMESLLLFWPYMAVVDAFQHWVYEHHTAASDPANCDAQWDALWGRFMGGVDWSGLDEIRMTGWQRKLHIFQVPFYYIEYGLAQLGAVQVFRNALHDQAGAVAAYRKALSLGGTVTLPELYRTAGAKFAFDAGTLGEAVTLLETTIAKLEQQ